MFLKYILRRVIFIFYKMERDMQMIFNEQQQYFKKLPVYGEYDVVVCGAGPAGIMAAITAARKEAKVAIIDRNGFPGGVLSACECPLMMGPDIGVRQIVGGITDEFVRELDKSGYARFTNAETGCPEEEPIGDRQLKGSVAVTGHGVIVTANRMLAEAGVECCFSSSVAGAVVEGRVITDVVVNMRECMMRVSGKSFVDATGDAELVYRAGGECVQAAADDCMTKTVMIRVGGVTEFYKAGIRKRFSELAKSGNKPFPNQNRFMGVHTLNPNEVLLNLTLDCGDALTTKSITELDVSLRSQIDRGLDWMRENFTEFKDCYLVSEAFTVGVRAGRAIVGHDTITTDDLDMNTPVEEPVSLAGRGYGGHGIKSFESPWERRNPGIRAIPLKSLIPVSFDNVCASGRCISAEARTLSSFRFTFRCGAIGQASGTLATISAAKRQKLTDVKYSELREALIADGAILE
jgi:hypothetical protein